MVRATTFMRSDAAPALANTAVTAGTYNASKVTVDAQGRITTAANSSVVVGPMAVPTGACHGIQGSVDATGILMDASCIGNITAAAIPASAVQNFMTPTPTIGAGKMCCGQYIAIPANLAIKAGEVVTFAGSAQSSNAYRVTQCETLTKGYFEQGIGILGVALNDAAAGGTVFVCTRGFVTAYGTQIPDPSVGGAYVTMSGNGGGGAAVKGLVEIANGQDPIQSRIVGTFVFSDQTTPAGAPTGANSRYLIWLNPGTMNRSS